MPVGKTSARVKPVLLDGPRLSTVIVYVSNAPAAELQKFLNLVDEVEDGNQVIITKRGVPKAVIVEKGYRNYVMKKKQLSELVLELDELLHQLAVESLFLYSELPLGASTLRDLPFFDPGHLCVALLLEGSDHRIDPETESLSLIGHPPLDAVGRLFDGALELLARCGA